MASSSSSMVIGGPSAVEDASFGFACSANYPRPRDTRRPVALPVPRTSAEDAYVSCSTRCWSACAVREFARVDVGKLDRAKLELGPFRVAVDNEARRITQAEATRPINVSNDEPQRLNGPIPVVFALCRTTVFGSDSPRFQRYMRCLDGTTIRNRKWCEHGKRVQDKQESYAKFDA